MIISLPKIYILLLFVSSAININIDVRITNETDKYSLKVIGPKGTFALMTDRNNLTEVFNPSEIESLSNFLGTFITKEEEMVVFPCRLWDPENSNVVVICTANDEIYSIKNSSVYMYGYLKKGNYALYIYCDDPYGPGEYYFTFKIQNFNIPFIYSDQQIINMDSEKESYELKFKADSFLGEKLTLVDKDQSESFTSFDELLLVNNELICNISRKKIEEILTYSKTLSLVYLNEELGPIPFHLVGDISIQYTHIKESIPLIITECLNPFSAVNSLVAFKTNITLISPLTTNKFIIKVNSTSGRDYVQCFFRKYEDDIMPLLLLCECADEDKYYFDFRSFYLELKEINYKYDFFIMESQTYQEIVVEGNGKRIYFNYPEVFDFTKNEGLTVEYFLTGIDFFENIRFVEDSPYLKCTMSNYSKTCIVPKSHFYGHQTGYYYSLYSSKHKNSEIALDSRPIKVIIEPNVFLKVKLEDNKDTIIVGGYIFDRPTYEYTYPVISFITNYDDTEANIFNISDIEETSFEIKFKGGSSYTYYVNCRLWKPESEKIRLFCTLKTYLTGSITFYNTSFIYKNYTVRIETENSFNAKFIIDPISFLYSDKQIIDLDKGEETYSLKFKYNIYYKEPLFLVKDSNYIPLYEKCEIGEKEIICNLSRNILEQNLIKGGNFKLGLFKDAIGVMNFNSVIDINIRYNKSKEKENITLIVNSPEEFFGKKGENIAFRTTSHLTPNIITDQFNMSFIDSKNVKTEFPCHIKISREKKLLNLLCYITEEEEFYLLVQNLFLTDIHYKYNFEVIKKELDKFPIIVSGKGTRVHLTYPYWSNLTFEKSVSLKYIMDEPSLEGDLLITQNAFTNKSEIVSCVNINKVKICNVPISFFEGKNDGIFYTYHLVNSGDYAPYYESNPFYFILPRNNLIVMMIPEDDRDLPTIGKNGIFSLITDYNDTKNIFNETDIEEIIVFNTSINVRFDNTYEVTCRLWNPENNNVTLFCQLHEDLKGHYIILDTTHFSYKGYEIFVFSEKYKEVRNYYYYEYELPFLYSNTQTINLDDDKETYELRFKILSYDNEFLFLRGNNEEASLILDNCTTSRKDLICFIGRKYLEQNLHTLGYYYMNYYIAKDNFHYDSFFDSVFSIMIDYREPIEKENIYLSITRILSNTSNYIGQIAFETNISSSLIPDLVTAEYFDCERATDGFLHCSFRKNHPNNLLFLCYYYTTSFYHFYNTKTLPFTNIHYKYNFYIIPTGNSISFYTYYPNIRIRNTFPIYIDLSLNNSANLKFIIDSAIYMNHLRLNLDSEDIKCESTFDVLDCELPLSHFKNKNSGYYYIYYPNNNNIWQILYDANPIYVKLPEEDVIVLRIIEENNKNIIKVGENGTLYFVTDYNDSENNFFEQNIEDKLNIETVLFDEKGNDFNVICRLWKQDNGIIRIFCDLRESLRFSEQNITLKTTKFSYNKQNFSIYSKDSLKVSQINSSILFMYYNPQFIYLNDSQNEDFHFLYFKLGKEGSYNGEKLFLLGEHYNAITFEKIYDFKDSLLCEILESQLKILLTVNNEKFKLMAINDKYGVYSIDNVLDITINSTVDIKLNINIYDIKLINNISEIGSAFTYTTNITNIPQIMTAESDLCRYKKNGIDPLLILCTPTKEGNFSMGNISESKNYDNVHYKYNITFGPLENYEYVYIDDYGTQIKMVYQNYLNLTFEEYLTVDFIMDNPHLMKKIKLNPDSNDELKCDNLVGMKRCYVPEEHFKGKKSGYYYLYHSNHLNEISIDLSADPIYVELPPENFVIMRIKLEDNKEVKQIGRLGLIDFVTNYYDKERNIFDSSDIENMTVFTSKVIDQKGNSFSVNCRLWKPTNEKVRLFCTLNEILYFNISEIILNNVSFSYKNYTIFIFSKEPIKVKQLSYKVPFLYYETQEINIREGIDSYEFKFKIDSYNKELLFIHQRNSYTFLDNCINNKGLLICKISKEKLEENLILFEDTQFKLSSFHNNLGTVLFSSVLDINIKYELVDKIDIIVEITKLLNSESESGVAVGYETNISTIPNLKTDSFLIPFYDLLKGEYTNISCYFKKNSKDAMLFLCDIVDNGYFYIVQTENNTILTNISYKYNFIVLPIEISNIIIISGLGTEIYLTYPNKLNFTIDKELSINYIMPFGSLSEKIKLNPESDTELECLDKGIVKTCIVPIEHFNNKKSDFYYTYHLNHLNKSSIYYSSTPFEVILPDEYTFVLRIKSEFNPKPINIGVKGTLVFVTDYNDTEKICLMPQILKK